MPSVPPSAFYQSQTGLDNLTGIDSAFGQSRKMPKGVPLAFSYFCSKRASSRWICLTSVTFYVWGTLLSKPRYSHACVLHDDAHLTRALLVGFCDVPNECIDRIKHMAIVRSITQFGSQHCPQLLHPSARISLRYDISFSISCGKTTYCNFVQYALL